MMVSSFGYKTWLPTCIEWFFIGVPMYGVARQSKTAQASEITCSKQQSNKSEDESDEDVAMEEDSDDE